MRSYDLLGKGALFMAYSYKGPRVWQAKERRALFLYEVVYSVGFFACVARNFGDLVGAIWGTLRSTCGTVEAYSKRINGVDG